MSNQAMQITQTPIESLIPYARNARTHFDAQVAQIAASIKEFGWTNPILTDDGLEDLSMYKKGLVGNFSDTIGSATKNKLLGFGPYGYGGHPDSYYKKTAGYGQQAEVFANLTSLLGSDSKVWATAIHSFYPTLTELFKDILK